MQWHCGDRVLGGEDRPLVMGILNVTPDSFSDGGQYADHAAAVEHGLRMVAAGADILDVGGESTRPGAEAVPEAEECRRVAPVVAELTAQTDVPLSVDTMKAGVAREAAAAGAVIINDVSAMTHDAAMPGVARDAGAGVVLMHMRGTPRTMQQDPQYGDVVNEIAAYLGDRVAALVASGLDRRSLAVDPGIGFGKTVEHNLALLAGIPRLAATGCPVVVGLSRKSFLGKVTGRDVDERLAGSLAALAYCVMKGVHVMRVHDVRQSVDALRVLTALRGAEATNRQG
jgi:dihydropteroate synthase